MRCMDVGNYRGDLYVKEVDGTYYWAVGCDLYEEEEWSWEEISKNLYDACVAEISD